MMTTRRWLLISSAVAVLLVPLVVLRIVQDVRQTRPVVASLARLVTAANRGDLAAVRDECSARYLRDHPPALAAEGGVVGLPRSIHPDFTVWPDRGDVMICPGNRQGPVYRYVAEAGGWRFDGLAGLLRNRVLMPVEADDEIGTGPEKSTPEKP